MWRLYHIVSASGDTCGQLRVQVERQGESGVQGVHLSGVRESFLEWQPALLAAHSGMHAQPQPQPPPAACHSHGASYAFGAEPSRPEDAPPLSPPSPPARSPARPAADASPRRVVAWGSPPHASSPRMADGDARRESAEGALLLSTLRAQLRELDGVHAQLQRHLARAKVEDEVLPRESAPELLWEPSEAEASSPLRVPPAPTSPSRDPDEQPPSQAPTPPSQSTNEPPPARASLAKGHVDESPARFQQIARALRASGASGLWDDDDSDS
ncbi:hypothetical protein T492DRAFT_868563 [Pavlovales sp. CCMP2436]|nr:hypothetical protein T492DRAFT_868563 [Pavlovales sp. CCMP2436]